VHERKKGFALRTLISSTTLDKVVEETTTTGSLALRKIRRVRNPMMVLSKMAPPPLRHSSATTVAKKATSLRTVRSLRSGALRKVMTTLFL
jgi:hypothetical protein